MAESEGMKGLQYYTNTNSNITITLTLQYYTNTEKMMTCPLVQLYQMSEGEAI